MDFTVTCNLTKVLSNFVHFPQSIKRFIETVQYNYSIYDVYKITYNGRYDFYDTTMRDRFIAEYEKFLPEESWLKLYDWYTADSLYGEEYWYETRTLVCGKSVKEYSKNNKHFLYEIYDKGGVPLFQLLFPETDEIEMGIQIHKKRCAEIKNKNV